MSSNSDKTSHKRTSDSNFWVVPAEEVTGKRYRTEVATIIGLRAVASIKLDGAQVVWNFSPAGTTQKGPMELDGIYTHNDHPVAINFPGRDLWCKDQPKFMGMDVQKMWYLNQDPLQILVDKLYLEHPTATSIRIFSELMHPTCGQVIKRQKGSIYNDTRPELVGTYQVFQAYVVLPGAEKPLMFRPSSVPEMLELFETVSTPEILLEATFGAEFVDQLCDILIARYLQDEGAVIHIVRPDGTEIGWKLRTGVTESGEVHYPFFNGTHEDIGHLSAEIQSMIGSLKRMFSITAPERTMKRATRSAEEMAAAQAARDAKKSGRGKGKPKQTIDMEPLRDLWDKIFTHRDYKTNYNEVRDQPDEVSNLRTQMLKAFRDQVVKDQVKTFLNDDGALKSIVVKNIEGATRNMPAFMKRR
jgi:hypothetical protein